MQVYECYVFRATIARLLIMETTSGRLGLQGYVGLRRARREGLRVKEDYEFRASSEGRLQVQGYECM